MNIYIYTSNSNSWRCWLYQSFFVWSVIETTAQKKKPGDDNQISTMELEATNHCSAIYGLRFTK